jgi:hypothetical protein
MPIKGVFKRLQHPLAVLLPHVSSRSVNYALPWARAVNTGGDVFGVQVCGFPHHNRIVVTMTKAGENLRHPKMLSESRVLYAVKVIITISYCYYYCRCYHHNYHRRRQHYYYYYYYYYYCCYRCNHTRDALSPSRMSVKRQRYVIWKRAVNINTRPSKVSRCVLAYTFRSNPVSKHTHTHIIRRLLPEYSLSR